MIHKGGNHVFHISAGGFVVDGGKVLLIKNLYHGNIVCPHGHQEKGEQLVETAMREICEETGYCSLRPIKKIGVAHYDYHVGKQMHHKTEHRWMFSLLSRQLEKKQTEESKSLQNVWLPITVAIQKATFPNMKQHLEIVRRLMYDGQTATALRKGTKKSVKGS